MKWRLSLEGASVLAACADRMENVCVMQWTASDKKCVFWSSLLCRHTTFKTEYVYTDTHERRHLNKFTPGLLCLLHPKIHHSVKQIYKLLSVELTIRKSLSEVTAAEALLWSFALCLTADVYCEEHVSQNNTVNKRCTCATKQTNLSWLTICL